LRSAYLDGLRAADLPLPLVGLIGLGFVLAHYMSRKNLSFGSACGILAVAVGTILAFVTHHEMPVIAGEDSAPPSDSGVRDVFAGFSVPGMDGAWSVILSMGLLNVLGTLQNIESAGSGGGFLPVAPTMVMNGVSTNCRCAFRILLPDDGLHRASVLEGNGSRSAIRSQRLFWIL